MSDTAPTQRVIDEIRIERERQTQIEGWSEEHDDTHANGEIAFAASCYANPSPEMSESTMFFDGIQRTFPKQWPWDLEWWNPSDPRRNYIKAAALLVAEIERLDRASKKEIIND